MVTPAPERPSRGFRFRLRGIHFLTSVGTLLLAGSLAGEVGANQSNGLAEPIGDVVELPVFKVTGEPLEDFGFRVSPDFDPIRSAEAGKRLYFPVVDVVLPNSAASKAGLRPGDRFLLSDERSTATGNMSRGPWRDIQKQKWTELSKVNARVIWKLHVEGIVDGKIREVLLRLPTPSPRWGGAIWRAPTDRTPVKLSDVGPLAARAEQVLNHGIWMVLRAAYVRGLQLPTDAAHPHFLCYQWTLWEEGLGHRIHVSQQRGRTDIVLEVIRADNSPGLWGRTPFATPVRSLASATTVLAIDADAYLTSPAGELERAWRLPRLGAQPEIAPSDAQAGFQAEVDFWLHRVGQGSPAWPMEILRATAATSLGRRQN